MRFAVCETTRTHLVSRVPIERICAALTSGFVDEWTEWAARLQDEEDGGVKHSKGFVDLCVTAQMMSSNTFADFFACAVCRAWLCLGQRVSRSDEEEEGLYRTSSFNCLSIRRIVLSYFYREIIVVRHFCLVSRRTRMKRAETRPLQAHVSKNRLYYSD